MLRVLVANLPRMYRESLAQAVRRHRPHFEVLVAAPKDLDGEAERTGSHVLVRDDDGVETGAPAGVLCWVGIIIDNHLNARISVNGRISSVRDINLDELFAALDETETLVSGKGS